MNIKEIKNARYLESGVIDCEVLFEGETEFVPYTAIREDTAATGQQIWQELQSGKWGEIASFTVTQEMLEAAKAAKRQEIEAWRAEQEAQPFTFEWMGRIWNGGPDSLARLSPISIASRSEGARGGFSWGDASNVSVPLTFVQLEGLLAAMVNEQIRRSSEIYIRQREMKDALNALEDLFSIRAFKIGQ